MTFSVSTCFVLAFIIILAVPVHGQERSSAPPENVYPAWSPKGDKIAFMANGEIFTINIDGTQPTRLTHNHAADANPQWSPDGTQIVFTSDRTGNMDIFIMDADGGRQRPIITHAAFDAGPSWAPDNRHIVFSSDRTGSHQLFILKLESQAHS